MADLVMSSDELLDRLARHDRELRRCYHAFWRLFPRPVEHLAWHLDARLARHAQSRRPPRRVAFRGFFGKRRHYYALHPHRALYELMIDTRREVAAFVERGWNGYAQRDLWDLDAYLRAWLPQAVRFYKSDGGTHLEHSCALWAQVSRTPREPTPAEEEQARRDWDALIERMAQGWEARIADTESEQAEERAAASYRLLAQWSRALWD